MLIACLFKDVSGSRDAHQQNRLFRYFKRPAVFDVLEYTQVCLGHSHCCR